MFYQWFLKLIVGWTRIQTKVKVSI